MRMSSIFFTALVSSVVALTQAATGESTVPSSPRTALPITFTKTVSADRARTDDVVLAKTTQAVRLVSGEWIPAGTEVVGHVAVATAFASDKTPYATQRESILEIQFDSLRVAGHDVPLKVTVRAMADPLTSWEARKPESSDSGSPATVTQIGGDELVPSQSQAVDQNGDVVASNRRNGVYAHLIARAGCDGSSNEVSVDIYSASACGLYGFAGVTARDADSATSPSSLSLVSTRTSPKIWRHSTALLEMLPDDGTAR